MPLLRPPSNEEPEDQSSKTPSGKKVPMAMSMMLESMVRMIQKATHSNSDIIDSSYQENIDEN